MDEERFDVVVLGRTLGTTSGWDGMVFYDFEPKEGINLEKGLLSIDYLKGEIGMAEEESGEVNLPLDIVAFLSGVSK